MAKSTPMMDQYRRIKARYADAILFFRLGDFYEMFSEDALTASRLLEITLTSRGKGTEEEVPMCGVPWHSADRYIARLTRMGHKVAICDQVEDAEAARGLVERDVVRVVTPGTEMDEGNLAPKEHNFLAAVAPDRRGAGLAFLDASTGDFWLAEEEAGAVGEALAHFAPREVLQPEGSEETVGALLKAAGLEEVVRTTRPGWTFEGNTAGKLLREHLGVASLEGFGCGEMTGAERAAGAALRYVMETQRSDVGHVRRLRRFDPRGVLRIDAITRRNLELVRTMRDRARTGSLLGLLDETVTAMGGRLIKTWLLAPLQDAGEIERRLDAVDALLREAPRRKELRDALDRVADMERLAARVRMGRATPRDLASLRASLCRLPDVRASLREPAPELLAGLREAIDPLEDLQDLLGRALVDEPPPSSNAGGIVREGYDAELDELREAARGGKRLLAGIEKREREATGISSLKVRHNRVFGYFLEVSKANMDRVPAEWTRRQTLTNSERYVTEELKEVESKVLGAQESSITLEERLFSEVRERVGRETARIQETAAALARADVLAALAVAADRRGYVRPSISRKPGVRVKAGRHPVVETLLEGERFVPNDGSLDPSDRQVLLLTGPNMGGKSTYLRQMALIVLMAHMGSFVPADEAEIGPVDRIFTRVGASDSLATGQSTFMMEMLETANILNNATQRSLVVLDEIGRGTATFDGLSLAWAVVEHLHDDPGLGCMTLFATHYHELTDLAHTLPRVHNLRVAVREWEDRIVFLRRVEEGTAERSYGIHVAKLAGLPASTLERAKEILGNLERNELDPQGRPRLAASTRVGPAAGTGGQMSLFLPPPLPPEVEEIVEADLSQMRPIDALNLLSKVQERLRGKGSGQEEREGVMAPGEED